MSVQHWHIWKAHFHRSGEVTGYFKLAKAYTNSGSAKSLVTQWKRKGLLAFIEDGAFVRECKDPCCPARAKLVAAHQSAADAPDA